MNLRLKAILEEQFGFRPNKNQLRELERLIFEIMHCWKREFSRTSYGVDLV